MRKILVLMSLLILGSIVFAGGKKSSRRLKRREPNLFVSYDKLLRVMKETPVANFLKPREIVIFSSLNNSIYGVEKIFDHMAKKYCEKNISLTGGKVRFLKEETALKFLHFNLETLILDRELKYSLEFFKALKYSCPYLRGVDASVEHLFSLEKTPIGKDFQTILTLPWLDEKTSKVAASILSNTSPLVFNTASRVLRVGSLRRDLELDRLNKLRDSYFKGMAENRGFLFNSSISFISEYSMELHITQINEDGSVKASIIKQEKNRFLHDPEGLIPEGDYAGLISWKNAKLESIRVICEGFFYPSQDLLVLKTINQFRINSTEHAKWIICYYVFFLFPSEDGTLTSFVVPPKLGPYKIEIFKGFMSSFAKIN